MEIIFDSGDQGFDVGIPDNIFGATSGDIRANPLTVLPAADRSTAEGVRDAYATANPTWLAAYDANASVGIYLYYAEGANNLLVGQKRIGGAWVDSISLRAVQGLPGSGTDFSNISDYHLPMIGPAPDKLPMDSGLLVDMTTERFVADKGLEVPPGTIFIGSETGMSAAIRAISLNSGITGNKALVLAQLYDETTGFSRAFVYSGGPATVIPINDPAGTDTSDTAVFDMTTTADELITQIAVQTNQISQSITFEATIRAESHTGPVAVKHSGSATTDASGVATIGIDEGFNPILVDSGTQLFMDIDCDGMIGVQVNPTTFKPNTNITRIIVTREEISLISDVTGMAFRPVVTTITSDVTIDSNNYDTYFGDGDFAIIQMFNSSGTISVDITQGVAPEGARLRIKHFDPTAQAINPWNLEIAGGTTERFQHPHRDALEQDVVGEMDSAYEWRLTGDDWLLDTSYVHDQFMDLKVQEDGVPVGVGARTLNFTGSVDVTGTQSVKEVNIIDNYVDSLTLDCDEDTNVLTITIGRTGTLPDLTASCTLSIDNNVDGIPSLNSLTINISSRVDLNTDLNNSRTLTFNATEVSELTGLTLLVTTGDNKTLTVPVTDGAQTQNVTLSGIDTSTESTLTFRLEGAYDGGTVLSNTVTVNVRDLAAHELVHFGHIPQAETANDIVFANDDINTAEQTDGSFTVSGIPNTGLHRVYFAVPEDFDDVVSIVQAGFNITNQFTETQRTIDSRVYDIWLLNSAAAVNENYNGEILTLNS